MSTSMSLGVSSRISSSSEPSTTVGHVPREISKLCCACLGRKEEGSLALTGPRHCSTITEGGLEVPCSLSFEGPPELLKKFSKVVNALYFVLYMSSVILSVFSCLRIARRLRN